MSLSLQFEMSYYYGSSPDGLDIPTRLGVADLSVDVIARLDTGATYCIFERKYADMLELDIESGRLQRFRTVAGSFAAHEHEVNLQTFSVAFSASVFFAQDTTFNRNFLGRTGWLDRLRIAIVDYDHMLFLSAYES
jgi:hypothetical protein